MKNKEEVLETALYLHSDVSIILLLEKKKSNRTHFSADWTTHQLTDKRVHRIFRTLPLKSLESLQKMTVFCQCIYRVN